MGHPGNATSPGH